MKIFGSWSELVKLVFRTDTQEVELQPDSATSYTATRTISLPPGDADSTIVAADTTQTLTNKTIVAANNTITTAASGNLAATELDAALDELQLDIDTRATSGALTTHTGASTGVHGVTGGVVGTVDTQTLQNKTITAASNTIVTAASGNLTATELNAALAELQADIDTRGDATDLTTHTGASSGVHGVTGSVVGTSDTQDLSNKTFTDSLTLEELSSTPSTPASGDKKIYAKDDGKLYQLNDAGEESELGSGGAGELNLIEDSSTSDNWTITGTLSAVTETTTTNLPLGPSVLPATGMTLTSGSAADYVRYRFTNGDALKSTKLKVQLYAKNFGAAGDFTVEIYKNSLSDYTGTYTQFSLSNEDIAADESKFIAVFDADDADYYEVRIVRAAGSSALTVQQVIAGPGAGVGQGPIITKWTAYTPAIEGLGTVTSLRMEYARVGPNLLLRGDWTNGTPTATEIRIPFPTGLTTDTIDGSSVSIVGGKWFQNRAASNELKSGAIIVTPGQTFLRFGVNEYASSSAPLSSFLGSSLFPATALITGLDGIITVPIAEWANSGTTNFIGGGFEKNRELTNFLTTNQTASSTDLADLRITDKLIVGRKYRISLNTHMFNDGSSVTEISTVTAKNGATTVCEAVARQDQGADRQAIQATSSQVFIATDTSMSFDYALTGTGRLVGDGTVSGSSVTLEELNNYTDFDSPVNVPESLVGFSEATESTLGLVRGTKWQRIIVPNGIGNITGTGNLSAISGLSGFKFNNIESGKTYRLSWNMTLKHGSTAATEGCIIQAQLAGGLLGTLHQRGDSIDALEFSSNMTTIFTASTSGTIEFNVTTFYGGTVQMTGDESSSAVLEELPSHTETTEWL